jgi:hypothetical protein
VEHPLAGATLKLQRANANLNALKMSIDRSRKRYPSEAIAYINRDAGFCIFAVELDPPPSHWAPLIGDVLHNIHSSLDHLIWELIRRRNYGFAPAPETRASFPIFPNRSKFWAKSKKGKHRWTSRSGAATLLQVPGDARRLILEVQPYNDRHRDHPLWHLYWLSNADKHQTLHYVHHAVVGAKLTVVSSRDIAIQSFEPHSGPIVAGRRHPIGVMHFRVVGEDPKFRVKPKFTFREAFAEGVPTADLSLIDALNEIMDFVVTEVFSGRFWPYFGANPDEEIALIRDHAKAYT